jgi:hypothetical protein
MILAATNKKRNTNINALQQIGVLVRPMDGK